ncbi:ATP synthase epsilon chain [Acetobacteraceae bacterium EV16G]|uniref:ATP synthase epsilon chain n=1 Tax=Sorlinia euscelidii TaxID=3081148 RepID=A0ABU7U0B9_9PROT
MPVLLEIISPEKILFSANVDMSVIPGEEGDIAAMPERAPLMISLRGGVLSYYQGEKVAGTFFIAGGFADMNAEKCTVLADDAYPVSDISTRDAYTALEGLEAALANVTAENVVEQDRIARRIQIVRAEIEAAEEKSPTH